MNSARSMWSAERELIAKYAPMLFAISRIESKPDSTAQIVKREKNGKRHGHEQGYFASAGEITYPYEAINDQKNCGDIHSCAAEIDGIPILKTDDYKHTCKHVEAVLFRIAQLFDLAVCFIGGICRDQPRRKFVGYPKISAEHLALYLGRKIDSLAKLFKIHASFLRARMFFHFNIRILRLHDIAGSAGRQARIPRDFIR